MPPCIYSSPERVSSWGLGFSLDNTAGMRKASRRASENRDKQSIGDMELTEVLTCHGGR